MTCHHEATEKQTDTKKTWRLSANSWLWSRRWWWVGTLCNVSRFWESRL